MYTTNIEDMDIGQIAESGQCFRINRVEGDIWSVRALGRYMEVSQKGQRFTFSCDQKEYEEIWRYYFDIDTDYGVIKRSVEIEDSYLTEAIQFGSGIRVLNQDLWEVIVSFLISQNNNIARIKKSIELLCGRFGEQGSFPGAIQIADCGMEGLRDLGLGYRDKYLLAIAESIKEHRLDLKELKDASYEEAHKTLMGQFGIGNKVADCICLFGLRHVNTFPVDTHIKKILKEYYPGGFRFERYQGYLGIIQQYLFYYDIKGNHHEEIS